MYKYTHLRKGDPPELVANISLSKKYLKWIPEKSDLESIVSSALNWSSRNKTQ